MGRARRVQDGSIKGTNIHRIELDGAFIANKRILKEYEDYKEKHKDHLDALTYAMYIPEKLKERKKMNWEKIIVRGLIVAFVFVLLWLVGNAALTMFAPRM